MANFKVTAEIHRTPDGGYRAFFHADVNGNEGPFPVVCLARTPGAKGYDREGNPRCSFPLDKLNEHDPHAPIFASKAALDTYLTRVRSDVENAVYQYENAPKTVLIFQD